MVPQCPGPLDPSISKRAYLLAVESIPFLSVELIIEREDEFRMDEVNECVADIAGIVVIDWEIKKVEFDFEVLVEFLEKELLSVLVRDVTDH